MKKETSNYKCNKYKSLQIWDNIITKYTYTKVVLLQTSWLACPEVKGLTCFKDLAWSQKGGGLKISYLWLLFIQKNWGPGCLGSTQLLVLFMDWLKKLINSHIMKFLKAKPWQNHNYLTIKYSWCHYYPDSSYIAVW